jgi:hypothetical protein
VPVVKASDVAWVAAAVAGTGRQLLLLAVSVAAPAVPGAAPGRVVVQPTTYNHNIMTVTKVTRDKQ